MKKNSEWAEAIVIILGMVASTSLIYFGLMGMIFLVRSYL